MQKYVALLRGINVGGNNKIEMPKLRTCFEKCGYENVRTYINSGNVIFESEDQHETLLVQQIELAIKLTFTFEVRVIVRSQKKLQKIATVIPKTWENNTLQKSDVLFLWEEYAHKKSMQLLNAVAGIDTLIYVDGAILWNVQRNNYNKSAMSGFIGTKLYKNMTARNINTVRKLSALLSS